MYMMHKGLQIKTHLNTSRHSHCSFESRPKRPCHLCMILTRSAISKFETSFNVPHVSFSYDCLDKFPSVMLMLVSIFWLLKSLKKADVELGLEGI